MELRLPRKSMTAILSAMVVGTVICTSAFMTGDTQAVEDSAAYTQPAVKSMNASEEANEKENNAVSSLVSYEEVETVDEETDEETAARGVIRSESQYPEINGATNLDVPEREYTDPINIESGNFGFTVYGYGHGVGLSQNGANFYATYGGMSYQDILAHYYPGTYISNTGTAQDEVISANGISGSVSDIVSRIVFTEIGSSMNVEAIML